MITRPFAFLLEPRPVARPWGGRHISERFGWDAGDDTVGEWWLASCYPDSTTKLRDTDLDFGAWLDGAGRALGYTHATFPLLLKFLDCEQVLSVQVHPSDEVARRQGLPRGKTEAWHVLHAEAGARVYLGTADGVSTAQLVNRIEAGAGDDEVRALLRPLEVQPGDTILVEAGTVHAIDRGLALFEVQQNSDTTYRVYDWGRGREVHLAAARQSLVDQKPPRPVRNRPRGDTWLPLVRGHAFSLWRACPDYEIDFQPRTRFCFVTVLAGEGEMLVADETLPLRAGDTALLVGEATFVGEELDLLATEPPA